MRHWEALLHHFAAVLTLSIPSIISQIVASGVIFSGLLGRWMLKIRTCFRPIRRRLSPSREEPAQWHWCYWCCRLFCCPCGRWLAAPPLAPCLLEGVPRWRPGLRRRPCRAALLQTAVVQSGTVSTADLLAGYGAARAVPGPLFSFAAYLGAMAEGPLGGWAGGLALLVVIFLPALLVLVGVLPFWGVPAPPQGCFQASIAGVNAGIVGILRWR